MTICNRRVKSASLPFDIHGEEDIPNLAWQLEAFATGLGLMSMAVNTATKPWED